MEEEIKPKDYLPDERKDAQETKYEQETSDEQPTDEYF